MLSGCEGGRRGADTGRMQASDFQYHYVLAEEAKRMRKENEERRQRNQMNQSPKVTQIFCALWNVLCIDEWTLRYLASVLAYMIYLLLDQILLSSALSMYRMGLIVWSITSA